MVKKIEYGFPAKDRPRKFGNRCLWYQWTKKGKVCFGFPKKAIALSFNTVADAVGICVEDFFEMKYVMKEELKKGWKRRGGR